MKEWRGISKTGLRLSYKGFLNDTIQLHDTSSEISAQDKDKLMLHRSGFHNQMEEFIGSIMGTRRIRHGMDKFVRLNMAVGVINICGITTM